jgi:hypothetical protein
VVTAQPATWYPMRMRVEKKSLKIKRTLQKKICGLKWNTIFTFSLKIASDPVVPPFTARQKVVCRKRYPIYQYLALCLNHLNLGVCVAGA